MGHFLSVPISAYASATDLYVKAKFTRGLPKSRLNLYGALTVSFAPIAVVIPLR